MDFGDGVDKSQNALVRGRQLCTQLSIFEGRKSRRIATFLMLSSSKIVEVSQICNVFDVASSKIEEVSQTCCVFDVVKFGKLKRSRRIAAFQSCR